MNCLSAQSVVEYADGITAWCFSFSLISCLTKAKEPCLPYYSTLALW